MRDVPDDVEREALGVVLGEPGLLERRRLGQQPLAGLLDQPACRLAGELSTIALELEATPFADFGDDEHMQAVAWCFVNEQEASSVAGRTRSRSTA